MAGGDDVAGRIAALSPARRELLLQRLGRVRTGRERHVTAGAAERLPPAAAQERLWLAQFTYPENVAYNIFVPVRIAGPVDVGALARSLSAIVDRHDVLRARFGEEGGAPFVTFSPRGAFAMQARELRDVTADERPAVERRLLRDEARRPIDLETGPLVRALLARWEERHATLLLTVHHIAADNWSMGVFCRELDALYASAVARLPTPWTHRERVEWERSHSSRVYDEQLRYWRAQLAGAPERSELPADAPRPAHPSFAGARVPVRLSAATTAGLIALARRHDATLFMTAVTALMSLLHRYTGQDDVVVGTDVVNRPRGAAEHTIGFFANQLALRADMSGNPPTGTLLDRVARVCRGAFAHQDVPFQDVVRALRPRGGIGHLPLFSVKLGFLHFPPAALRLRGTSVTPIHVEGTAKFDVELILWVEAGELRGFFEYSTDLFTPATIERLALHYRELLAELARDEWQPILDVPLSATVQQSAAEPPSADRFRFER